MCLKISLTLRICLNILTLNLRESAFYSNYVAIYRLEVLDYVLAENLGNGDKLLVKLAQLHRQRCFS